MTTTPPSTLETDPSNFWSTVNADLKKVKQGAGALLHTATHATDKYMKVAKQKAIEVSQNVDQDAKKAWAARSAPADNTVPTTHSEESVKTLLVNDTAVLSHNSTTPSSKQKTGKDDGPNHPGSTANLGGWCPTNSTFGGCVEREFKDIEHDVETWMCEKTGFDCPK